MLSKALALHLAGLGLVRYPPTAPGTATPCYIEDAPSTPDTIVVIRSEQGFPATDLSGYELPELRVLIRTATDTGVQSGYDTAETIRRALKDTSQLVWAPGTEHEADILTCDAGEPAPIPEGKDPSGRPVWSVSFQINTLTEVLSP